MLVTKIAKHYIATLTSTPDTKQETPGNIAHMSLILTQASSRSQTQKALSGIKSLVKKKKKDVILHAMEFHVRQPAAYCQLLPAELDSL